MMTAGSTALANPEGPTVRHGQINFSPGTQAQIQQLTDRAIVDWQSFSIGRTESLVFLQPSQLSVILNRVTGGDPSAILGQLSANGNVFLINPNGILFGPDSVVNVGGLVASTLNLNDDDFLAGNYKFFADPNGELGAVVNQGRITISDGGYAVLTGPAVLNEGMIVAKAGKVVLASGERATLNLDGRDLVHFSLDSSIGEGDVLLAPGALSETLTDALGVNQALRADRLVQEADGSVRMVRSSGTLVQAGTVSVNGSDGVDAGSILLDSTDVTILAADSVTSASGVGIDSEGGEVFVLSDMDGDRSLGFTDVHSGALISATGGTTGNAGFVEVSGNRLNLYGEVDLSAAGGEGGTFLLDPQTYTIIDGDNMPNTVGDLITVGDQYFNTLSSTTLVITSTGDVIFDLGTQGTNPTNDGVMNFRNVSNQLVNLTINSGTDPDPDGIIDFGDDGITVSGLSALTLNSEGGVLFGDSDITVNGSVNVDSVGAIQLQTGTLRVTNGGDITLDGEAGINLGSGSINPGAGAGTTGFLHIVSNGEIDLGTSNLTVNTGARTNPFSIIAGSAMAPAADLLLGDAQMSISSSGNPVGNTGLVLTATGDIDFGSSNLSFYQDRDTIAASYQDRITAGGNIYSSAAPDGDPNNFLNNYVITGDSGPLDMTAGGSIVLTDLLLDVNEADGTPARFTTIAAGGGDLDLGSSQVNSDNSLTLTSTSNIIFDSPTLTTINGGSLDIDAGGTVTFQDGTLNSNGFLHIHGDGDVSLGTSTLTVNTGGTANPLSITAGDAMAPAADLLLGDAQMSVFSSGNPAGNAGLRLTATGDMDLGSSDLTYTQNRNTAAASYQDLITADGRIFSSVPADGNPNTFVNNYLVTGDSGPFRMTAGTDISLNDINLVVNEFDGGTRTVLLTAPTGQLLLGESQIVANDGDARLQAAGLIDVGSSRVTTVGQLALSTNTAVAADGSSFQAPDIEVFGFDPITMIPGGAVNGDVRLDLGITTSVDLTVLATGDVEVNNVGGGTIVAEQIGGVAFSSSGGDVAIRTDGNLTRQGGGTTEVSAAGAVTLVADNILGSPYRVQGSQVVLDISAVNGSSMNVDIQGSAPSFLSVVGNDSTIAVRELASGRSLTVTGNQVNLPDLGIEEILVSNFNGLVLNSLVIGADQSVGMKAVTGDITATATNSVDLAGSLALEAGGSVGQNLLPINVAGETLAVDSGNQVFIEGTGPDLTIGTVLFDQDPSTPQKSLTGVTAAGDIEIAMTGSGPTQLIQDADISSTGGNVALAAGEGSLIQNSGTVRGADVALQADGNAGEFDGTDVLSEFSVEAERLVLNIGGDAVINQTGGDLTIAQQTTVGGDVYTGRGTGGDLRVRNSGGNLTVDTDIVAGGDAALITGSNLTVNQAPLPNSILFNGSVTAGDSLVVISAGDINQSSGNLTAPKIGLGAVGQIGTAGQPISVVTDEMALNPLSAQVSDPNGFTPVASVSAVGATVNQGVPTPDPEPEPEPVVPPNPITPPDTVIPPSAFEPPADFVQDEFAAEAFSANNTEMVEEIFAVLEMLDDPIVEEDPTRVPILWPEDEDFLQKKFRR